MTASIELEKRIDLSFVLFLLCFYMVWVLRVWFLLPLELSMTNEWARQCVSQSVRILLWVAAPMLLIRYYKRVPVLDFLRLNSFACGPRLNWGAAIVAGYIALVATSSFLFQGGSLAKLETMTGSAWAQLIVSMSIVAFAEETFYRGYVYSELRTVFSFHQANCIQAVLFLMIHWSGWLYMQGLHSGLIFLSISIFFAGWVFGLVREITGSIWLVILLHFLNNVCAGVLLP